MGQVNRVPEKNHFLIYAKACIILRVTLMSADDRSIYSKEKAILDSVKLK